MLSQSEIEELAFKQQTGRITLSEKLILDEWYANHDDTIFCHSIDHGIVEHKVWRNIKEKLPHRNTYRLWPKWVAAACLVAITGTGIYFALSTKPKSEIIFSGSSKDINPGRKNAILILSDGKQIDLSRYAQGSIAYQAEMEIRKTVKGTIEYARQKAGGKVSRDDFNTVQTPSGSEFELVLPDGSKVWLNAHSSLRYPVSFEGKARRVVELIGEAYFEVSKDASHPFVVKSAKQEITVLGTHFNVNTYVDEPIVITALLEGSVRLSNGSTQKTLAPGQRSLNDGSNIIVSHANLSQDVAWKNGYFEFSDTDLKTVMRQISRWYGLRVNYSGKMPDKRFTGKIHRNLKLSSALKILSYFEVKFTVSDKEINIEN